MQYKKYLAVLLLPIFSHWASAQAPGEPTPEELDAAFTEADAAREAAGWSDKVIERAPVDPLATMLAGADLVVRGTVTGQETVYDANDVPFTHTTFGINEVLRGSYAGSHITVVQEGGPARDNPENVLMLTHTHYFTPGQEELLFLQLDPDNPYSWRQVEIKNRFGLLNGKVFSESGRGLIYTETDDPPGYRLSWSRDRNPHPRFTEFKIGSHEFSKQFKQRDENVGLTDSPLQTQQKKPAQPGYQASVDFSTLKQALSGQGG